MLNGRMKDSEEEEKRNAVTRFSAGVAELLLGGRMLTALKGNNWANRQSGLEELE